MTVLQSLAGYYDRLRASENPNGKPPEYGYSMENISYAVVLTPNGKPADVQSLLNTSGKPSRHRVPQAFPRSGKNPIPYFLWDKTAFVLGKKRDSDTGQVVDAAVNRARFSKFHEDILAGAEDPGLRAFRIFLREWQAERYENDPFSSDMLNANVVFRLDGDRCFLHDRPIARSIWLDYLAGQDSMASRCLVTGENGPTERLHPKIKGVKDAQSSGASIVSFNLDAFNSFGKKQGANSPVSKIAAFKYTTALNHLLARASQQRIQIGDMTTVFWAEAAGDDESAKAAEDLFSRLADPPTDEQETVKVADEIKKIAEGWPLKEVVPKLDENTHFYILGLAPNASRLSIRLWCQDSIGEIARRIGEHWFDLNLEPPPWRVPPAAWRLLRETAAQSKIDNIPPTLGGALMRAILTGSQYPRSLLGAVIARIRADKQITRLRAAICKACLARNHRMGFEEEDVPVSLNPDEINPAYRLGRLFAVYENAQRAALGKPNTTIKDQYFGAASATPASVFPLLAKKSANHLASLRKQPDKARLANWFERQIDSICAGLDTTFPRSLRLEEQGRFVLGYYHQRAGKDGASNGKDDTGTANIDSHDKEK